MKNFKTKIVILLILMFIGSFSAFGQMSPATSATPPAQINESNDETIKVNTLLLNIPVIASDREGRSIAGLTKKDFIITQSGEKQPIEFFSDEYAPMNVAIVVDTSGSTIGLMSNIKEAARSFLKVLRPEDKAMIVSFDGRVKIWSGLTSDQKDIEKALYKMEMVQLEGTTMYDAIDEVNNKFLEVKGRKAIILLTDGIEDSTRITNQEFMRTLSESDTVIYPVLFLLGKIPKNSPFKLYFDYAQAMASTTAGKLYYSGSDLKIAFQSIADELRKQYVVGFYPTNSEGGKLSPIKIEVDRKDVVIRTKNVIRLKTPKPEDK